MSPSTLYLIKNELNLLEYTVYCTPANEGNIKLNTHLKAFSFKKSDITLAKIDGSSLSE